MLEDEHTRQWLIQTGRILVADLMRHDKKDPADFFDAYDRMTQFLKEPSSYQIMAEELMQRNVSSLLTVAQRKGKLPPNLKNFSRKMHFSWNFTKFLFFLKGVTLPSGDNF